MPTRQDDGFSIVVMLVGKGSRKGKVLYRAEHRDGLCGEPGCPCSHNVRPASAVAHGNALDLQSIFAGCYAAGLGGWLPTVEVLARAGRGWSTVTLGRALKAAGCIPYRSATERGWRPPEGLEIPVLEAHQPVLRGPSAPQSHQRRREAREAHTYATGRPL